MALPITIYPVRFSTCNEREYCRSRRFSCSLVNHDLHWWVILFCGFTETAGLPPGSAAHSLPALPLLLHGPPLGGGFHHRLHLTRPVPLPLLCPSSSSLPTMHPERGQSSLESGNNGCGLTRRNLLGGLLGLHLETLFQVAEIKVAQFSCFTVFSMTSSLPMNLLIEWSIDFVRDKVNFTSVVHFIKRSFYVHTGSRESLYFWWHLWSACPSWPPPSCPIWPDLVLGCGITARPAVHKASPSLPHPH